MSVNVRKRRDLAIDNNNVLPSEKSSDNSSSKKVPLDHGAMLVLFISLVLDLLAFTMILPLLPQLLEYYGQKEDGLYRALRKSVDVFRSVIDAPDTPKWNTVLFGGLIGSMFSLLQFLASPIIGSLSDIYGRRNTLIFSMFGVCLSYLLWMYSHTFSIFVLARFIGGISKGNISISTAIITDLFPVEKRGKGMALIGIAFSIGFLIGPTMGAYFSVFLKKHGEEFYFIPASVAFVLTVIDLLFLIVFFKETLPSTKRGSSIGLSIKNALLYVNPMDLFKFKAANITDDISLKNLQKLGLIYFLYMFIFSGLEFTLTFLTYTRFNYTSTQQGKMFFFIGLIMIIVQGGYIRRLKPGTEQLLSKRGMVILIPAFIIIGSVFQTILIFIGLFMFSFASATVVPCLTSLASAHGDDSEKGKIIGIFRSLGAMARASGPVVSSAVYWSAGPLVCYCAGALALLVPLRLLASLKLQHSA